MPGSVRLACMSEEILINVTQPETRVALIENGVVQEILIERTANRGLVGNIYKGRVTRVLAGMQAAFVDIGLERDAYLYVDDAGASRQRLAAVEGVESGESDEPALAIGDLVTQRSEEHTSELQSP